MKHVIGPRRGTFEERELKSPKAINQNTSDTREIKYKASPIIS